MPEYLSSSFCVEAIRKREMVDVEKILSNFPDASKVRGGTSLKYLIGKPNDVVLELGDGKIIYTFYFQTATRHTTNVNLLKFLAILAYLGDCYDVRINSIYQHLTEAIASSNLTLGREDSSTIPKERIENLGRVNVSLAGEMRKLRGSLKTQTEILNVYKRFCSELIEKIPNRNPTDIASALKSMGTSEDIADAIAKDLAEMRPK